MTITTESESECDTCGGRVESHAEMTVNGYLFLICPANELFSEPVDDELECEYCSRPFERPSALEFHESLHESAAWGE